MLKINMLAKFCVLLGGLSLMAMPVLAQEDSDFLADMDTSTEQVSSPDTDSNAQAPKSAQESAADEEQPAAPEEDFDDPKNRETWLESLITQGANELFRSRDVESEQEEDERIKKVLKNRRSNAALFDISKVKLRMNPEEVEQTLKAQGYVRTSQEMRIPNFIRWRAEELCRIHSVIGFERLKACAREVAARNGFEYIAAETYNRQSTRETISVFYTSVFTNNLAHYIYYESNLPVSVSRASQYVYINNLKIYDFWRRIDLRYGKPDNTSEVKWGLGGKKPFLKASTGRLELSDPLLKELDSSRMLNEDARLSNTPYYSF